ncbi:MAG: helix-turn-helix domain-containing protein [Clostridia bacterium]|nr:helix-turn-helix domain-containing protein [Clostridia bacterium]
MEKTKNKIKELRISKNLTQQQLADELHVTKQAISKWEKGKSVPDITSVELISSFFGVSVDYLINDNIEMVNCETATAITSKRINKLIVVLISALALMLAAVIALSVTLGVVVNKNKSDTVSVNGFEITYLSDETYINKTDKTIKLHFNIYNSTDFTKQCVIENFAVDNKELYIQSIDNDRYLITAHEELKIAMFIMINSAAVNLGALQSHSVTIKYAGQAIANVKW